MENLTLDKLINLRGEIDKTLEALDMHGRSDTINTPKNIANDFGAALSQRRRVQRLIEARQKKTTRPQNNS